jgi:hypothetical protein
VNEVPGLPELRETVTVEAKVTIVFVVVPFDETVRVDTGSVLLILAVELPEYE